MDSNSRARRRASSAHISRGRIASLAAFVDLFFGGVEIALPETVLFKDVTPSSRRNLEVGIQVQNKYLVRPPAKLILVHLFVPLSWRSDRTLRDRRQYRMGTRWRCDVHARPSSRRAKSTSRSTSRSESRIGRVRPIGSRPSDAAILTSILRGRGGGGGATSLRGAAGRFSACAGADCGPFRELP